MPKINLRRAVLAVVLLAGAFSAMAADAPRYIFYFIGDGMGLGHVNAAQAYNRIVRGNAEPLLMLQFPVCSFATTYSASATVTDSAAAGTALATGTKTRNGMLGMAPDTTAVQSVAAELFRDGWGVGIVTSVAPDDATPAAFYAHQPSRSMFYEIGSDAASCGYQFIAGGNLRGTKDKDGKPNDLMRKFKDNNVDIVRGLDALAESTSERVLLLNADESAGTNIGYTIDSVAGAMTLPAMTEACLKHLERTSPERFFIMVEGGDIDHVAHGNDSGATIKEILNFNEAIAVAYKFYLAHPDETLIVVTADHDTGALALDYKGNANIGVIDSQRVSKDAFSAWCKGILKSRRVFTWDDMKEYLADNFGFWGAVQLSDKETERLHKAFDKTFEQRNTADQKTLYNSFNDFAVKVFDILNYHAGISFTSTSHSGNFVPVFAIGAGADRFKGFKDNTHLPRLIYKH